MKTVVTRFLRDQSGAADFNDGNDGLIIVLLLVVFPIVIYFMLSTFGGVYDAVFGLLGSAVSR